MFMVFALESSLERYFAHSGWNLAVFLRPLDSSGGLVLRQGSLPSPGEVQIGQRTENKQCVGVFGKATVADLGNPEDTLHDPKDMLGLRADFRLGTIAQPVGIRQRFMPAGFCLGKILCSGYAALNHIALAGIGRVTPDAYLISVQQLFQYPRVMDIGGRRRYRVYDLGLAVDANVSLHAEVPLISLLGLE